MKEKRYTFTAIFERKHNQVLKGEHRNYGKLTYLFKNIRFKENNKFFIPHVWFNNIKGIKLLDTLQKTNVIEFTARVIEYGDNKYTLKNPGSIKNLSVDYIPSEKKEIKIKKLGKRAKSDLLNKLIKEQKKDMKYNL